jgi:hypothetical protein
MFDFGSILGSSPDRRWSGNEYLYEKGPTLAAWLSRVVDSSRGSFISTGGHMGERGTH